MTTRGTSVVSTLEVFTLSHAFHMESRWSPGTLPGFYLDSMYFTGGGFWQWTPAKPGPESTWSLPGTPGTFPGFCLESQGLQAPGLGRDYLESRYSPLCDMLLETNYPYMVNMLSLVMFVTYFKLRYIFRIFSIFFNNFCNRCHCLQRCVWKLKLQISCDLVMSHTFYLYTQVQNIVFCVFHFLKSRDLIRSLFLSYLVPRRNYKIEKVNWHWVEP